MSKAAESRKPQRQVALSPELLMWLVVAMIVLLLLVGCQVGITQGDTEASAPASELPTSSIPSAASASETTAPLDTLPPESSVETVPPAGWIAPPLEVPADAVAHLEAAELMALPEVRALLLTHSATPSHVLQYLYDTALREDGADLSNIAGRLLKHPNVPVSIIVHVATDIDTYPVSGTVSRAILHPQLPYDTIRHVLLADIDVERNDYTDRWKYRVETLLKERDGLPAAEVRRLSTSSPSEYIRELATERLTGQQ